MTYQWITVSQRPFPFFYWDGVPRKQLFRWFLLTVPLVDLVVITWIQLSLEGVLRSMTSKFTYTFNTFMYSFVIIGFRFPTYPFYKIIFWLYSHTRVSPLVAYPLVLSKLILFKGRSQENPTSHEVRFYPGFSPT